MTAPLSSAHIDDLLSELQFLETKTEGVPAPVKKELPPPPVAAAPKIIVKKSSPFAPAAICSLLFFVVGIFAADFFVSEAPTEASEVVLSSFDPSIAALQGPLQQLATTRRATLLSAIDQGAVDLNKIAKDNQRLTSLALLKEWHALKQPELKDQFIELSAQEGLKAFLPAQITRTEKLKPLYYYSDSALHLNLNQFHQKILHDIP